MILSLLNISGLAFAAFMGAIVGAGLTQSVQREQRKSELEIVTAMLNAMDASHGDVEALINKTAELAGYNAQIISVLQLDRTAAFVKTTGRPN